jgi:hypothetical protein
MAQKRELPTNTAIAQVRNEQALDRLIVWCKLLISMYFSLPHLSSICHRTSLVWLDDTLQPTFSQSYPQIL